jgi:hypothetical protein
LEVEGAVVARAAEGLAWSHVNRRIDLQANISDDVWLLRGRIEWSGGTAIVRTVFALPGCGLWIADFLEGCTKALARWHWHLPAALRPLEALDDEVHGGCAVRHDHGVLVQWSNMDQKRLQIELAEKGSPTGWQATNYGKSEKAYHVTVERVALGTDLVVTFLGPAVVPAIVEMQGLSLACGEAGAGASERVSFDQADSARISVCQEEYRDVYLVGPAAENCPDAYVPLNGKGCWPAAHRRCAKLSTVCGC